MGPTLTLTEKLKVTYCIPLWLRDEQIKLSTARVKGRIEPCNEPRTEPIAIVGFGPSLQDTWEEIRGFKYIITCSGSHKFLIERGIIPTWHVEVDPRDHKIGLLGSPHADVTYLPASTCHPKYFDHLEAGLGAERFEQNVKLWHIFDASEDGLRQLPPGEWAVMGGCDAGLRALTLAAFLGFRELHIFGLDGCAREGTRHAADHPYGKQKFVTVEHEGVQYATTPAMLEAAKQVFHELNQLDKVTPHFHGIGLIQALAKSYEREESPSTGHIAFVKPELISSSYRELNERLHRDNLAYGVGGGKHADTVIKLADSMKTRSVLDYGCGKGYLAKALPFPIWEYDPAIPEKAASPRPADLVICTDVLEHIEPDKLFFVLGDLQRVVRQVGYFVIHTGPSSKQLADGRNSHLIQRDERWWTKHLRKFFKIGKTIMAGPLLYVIVAPKLMVAPEPAQKPAAAQGA
jgi:hypothetical protein